MKHNLCYFVKRENFTSVQVLLTLIMRLKTLSLLTTTILSLLSLAAFAQGRDTVYNIKEAVVFGEKGILDINSTQSSFVRISKMDVLKVPAVMGEIDVIKTLHRIPGFLATGDGRAGIYVRGGDYDQNQIRMDGAILYSAEHLKGFMSAINPDMIEDMVAYKGAFPAQYGGQLSSVIDIKLKDGDYQDYHGSLSIGLIASKIQAEGPIWKGRTSFNIGARVSYINLIMIPILTAIADNSRAASPFINMNYYDITAKLSHKFNNKHKLAGVFYISRDTQNESPSPSVKDVTDQGVHTYYKVEEFSGNIWGNTSGSLNWSYTINPELKLMSDVVYSRYNYNLDSKYHALHKIESYERRVVNEIETRLLQKSDLEDMSIDFSVYHNTPINDLTVGIKGYNGIFSPIVNSSKKLYQEFYYHNENHGWNSESILDTISGCTQSMKSFSIYAQDDLDITNCFGLSCGLRYTLYSVPNKIYHSIEPRAGMRFMITQKAAFKLSYARMSQGAHQLVSSTLYSPSDIWVPITENIPLMSSDIFSAAYQQEMDKGFKISLEGYYKTMGNLLEYREGSSALSGQDWEKRVVLGKGWSYGVEFLLERSEGNTTGWINYTWSKSLRLFDEINNGKKYYSPNDRRHNFGILLNHRFNYKWDISLSWTYQTGRFSTIPGPVYYSGSRISGIYITHDSNKHNRFAFDSYDYLRYDERIEKYITDYISGFEDKSDDSFFRRYTRVDSYTEKNGYKFPDIHRLDISVNYNIEHRFGESVLNLSIYNLYNRMNITSAYMGFNEKNNIVMKGVCLLPFMPSVSYTFKF